MIIRPFISTDLEGLRDLSKCFPSFQRKAFKFEGLIFVAEEEGKLLGAIKGRIIPTPKGWVGGILWLMIHPEVQSFRGRTITKPLMDRLLGTFDEKNTRWQIACIDLSNLPSSRGVEHFGFQPAGLKWSLKAFGLSWPRVAYSFWHLVDIGQILWVRGEPDIPKEGASDYLFLLILFTLPWWFISNQNPATLLMAFGLIALRDVPQHLIAIILKEKLCFRGFDSALLPALLFACIGLWVPYFGTWIPCEKDNAKKRTRLAKIQVVGVVLFLLFLMASGTWGPPDLIKASWQLLLSLPLYFLAEFLIRTFPFKSSIANRLLKK